MGAKMNTMDWVGLAAAPFTGGLSLAIPAMHQLQGNAPKAPAAIAPPAPPDPEVAIKQSQLDSQKADARRSTDMTNIGGAKGILTDPNATYGKKTLLGA